MSNTNNTTKDIEIDESLYSRQLYVLGEEAMKRMGKQTVLISGLDGVGIELAKNVILNGVHAVILHDTKQVTDYDLSTGFYFTSEHVANCTNRAIACRNQMAELNSYVKVTAETGNLEDLVKSANVLATTDCSVDEQTYLNDLCRKHNVKYVHAEARGVFTKIFVDFGPEFVVNDADGETPTNVHVKEITVQDNKVVVLCTEEHNLECGKHIKLVEVEGPSELNDNEYEVKVINRYAFSINHENTDLPKHVKGGLVVGIKKPVVMTFKPMSEAINEPEFLEYDWAHMERPQILHDAFNALSKFELTNKRKPKSHNKEDVDEFMATFKANYKGDIDEDVLKFVEKFANTSAGQIIYTTGFVGAFAAQEVVKVCTGKFTPVHQWFYFDSIDSLPDEDLPEEEYQCEGRYKAQVAVLGKKLHEKVLNSSTFVVGSGAIGCELLKYFTMSGIGSGNDSEITVTDMDTIEKSNLNRQFLFRPHHIGKLKSQCAAETCKSMNPNVNIVAHENKVCPETETIYNEEFFNKQAFISNALDNVQARRYVDSRCVTFGKSLLESGTLGTKGNTQIVKAHLTESYGSQDDPPEKEVPFCTLKSFPANIDHTTQWARDGFEGDFVNAVNDARKYLEDPEGTKRLPIAELGPIYHNTIRVLTTLHAETYEDCMVAAYTRWHDDYYLGIKQLLHQFPADHVNSDGIPFWSGSKRCPQVEPFSVDNDDHMEYIRTWSRLWADVHGIKPEYEADAAKRFISTLQAPEFVPNTEEILTDDKEAEERAKKQLTSGLDLSLLPDPTKFENIVLTPLEFEKDDDANGHIDFVTISSNTRAENYRIEKASRHRIKGIAGKIIPAIATTTAIVAGLVSLEALKVIQNKPEIESYRNIFLNIALPLVAVSEPAPATKTKVGDKEFTLWDNFVYKGDRKLSQFVDELKDKIGFDVVMIVYGSLLVYSTFQSEEEVERIGKLTVKERIEEMTGESFNLEMISLVVAIDTDDEDNDEVPEVKFYF